MSDCERSSDLVDIQVELLDAPAEAEERSRAALIHQAVDDYLARKVPKAPEDDAFGL